VTPQLHPHLLELFCQGVRVRGTAVTHLRVSDMMNEDSTWLDMTTLELWPLSATEMSDPERHDGGRLRKSSIELATEASESPPVHTSEEFGFHVVKTPRRVLVLTANFAIRADLHVTNQADIQNTLDVFRGSFLPLTTASATPISAGRKDEPFARKFVLVNIAMINLVCDAAEAPPVFFPE
jgi:hypothetical protein